MEISGSTPLGTRVKVNRNRSWTELIGATGTIIKNDSTFNIEFDFIPGAIEVEFDLEYECCNKKGDGKRNTLYFYSKSEPKYNCLTDISYIKMLKEVLEG